jgi:signal transduction histidine kinase
MKHWGPLEDIRVKSDVKREVNLSQRAFLANLRHALRTPINAIIGYSEMLLEDAESKGYEEFIPDLQKILKGGRELLTLVSDILDPTRDAVARAEHDIDAYGAHLRHALRTPLNSVVGYTEMLLERTEEKGDGDFRSDLQKIDSSARSFLSLIEDVVNFSKIQAGERPEGDASETLSIIREAVKTIRPVEEDSALQISGGGDLLIVDDNEISRDLLTRHLQRQGHHVTVAENGRQALEMIQTHSFDLMLLDIMMPEMNGYQVLQHLKNNETWRDIPVIIISALEELGSVVRCIEMGAEDYLFKPLNPVLLKARIDACLEKKRLRDHAREQQERLAELGENIAGLAHCVKNLLNGFKGGEYIVNRAIKKQDLGMMGKGWSMVEKNIGRVSKLVLDMLTYVKDREPEYSEVDLNNLIEEAKEVLSLQAEKMGVEIKTKTDENLRKVTLDSKGIVRCLVNLIGNGIDACSEEGGVVSVESRLDSDDYFELAVSDTGCGMDQDTLKVLFRKFFSTKGSQGTGLGLPVVQQIVKEHHGSITVKSEPGHGTTFTLRLPRHPPPGKLSDGKNPQLGKE